ncbi:hypothetical protein [Paenibacillus sp. PCH8]|uniref:hypothetical protein n=1 Tax=Paenibacillus sp. PCH8 TaxID=2066524 RepID=UPI0015E49682|nr:hypothetical protein [Paenibacillus sp. PCH8]
MYLHITQSFSLDSDFTFKIQYKMIAGREKFFLYMANFGAGIGVLMVDSSMTPSSDRWEGYL